MNKHIQSLIQSESDNIVETEETLEKLKAKWFKTASTFELIKFLEVYIELKENLIRELKKEVKKNEVKRNAL